MSFLVSYLGTCRVRSPLHRGQGRYGYSLNLGRNYGFVHTSAEALQQHRFLVGELDVPAELQKFVFRPSGLSDPTAEEHTASDLYFVEISSAKALEIDGVPIQLNYVSSYYADFFSDLDRARKFWRTSAPGQVDERMAWIAEDTAFRRLDAGDQRLLAAIRRRELGQEDVASDMVGLIDRIGRDKIVFVTHVNALTPNDEIITSRNRMIRIVAAEAKRLDVRAYEPTSLMTGFGQMRAMERDGIDLTHYTPAFADQLCAEWNRLYIAPARAAVPGENAVLVPTPDPELLKIELLIENGDMAEASHRLRSALRSDPSLAAHCRLLARIQHEFGDYEGALALMEQAVAVLGATDEDESLQMACMFELGDLAGALNVGRKLLGNEVEDEKILRVCAASAAAAGDHDEALALWQRLFRGEEYRAQAASEVLDILVRQQRIPDALIWAEQVLEQMPNHNACAGLLWKHTLQSGDSARLWSLSAAIAPGSEEEILDMVRRALEADVIVAAAQLLARGRAILPGNPEIEARAAELVEQWFAEAQQHRDEGDVTVAATLLYAACLLAPRDGRLARALRGMLSPTRLAVRKAYSEDRLDDVLALLQSALDAGMDHPELHLFRARAATKREDFVLAAESFRRLADSDAGTLDHRRQLARAAARAGNILLALQAHHDVVERSDDPAIRTDSERNIASLSRKAVREARQEIMRGDFEPARLLLAQAARYAEAQPLVDRENIRASRLLRDEMKLLDPADAAGRSRIGQLLLRFDPNNPLGLKTVGMAMVRTGKFEQALEHFQRLRPLIPDTSSIDMQIAKCRAKLERERLRIRRVQERSALQTTRKRA